MKGNFLKKRIFALGILVKWSLSSRAVYELSIAPLVLLISSILETILFF